MSETGCLCAWTAAIGPVPGVTGAISPTRIPNGDCPLHGRPRFPPLFHQMRQEIRELEAEARELREQLAYKDHRWDEMRHQRDQLREALERIATTIQSAESSRVIARDALGKDKDDNE